MKRDGWMTTFEAYVEKVMRKSHLPGVAVGLAKDGQVFYEKGFGYRDVENQLKVMSDTVFAIGSITKSFTCVALLQLQEQGKISLHDSIKKYLLDFHLKKGAADQITIHHLMTHTSGLPDLQTFPMVLYDSLTEDDFKYDPTIQGNKETIQPIRTYKEYLTHISLLDFEMLCNPGEEWHYSNDGYGLLEMVIEGVSGKPYDQYVKENILEPSRMKMTSFFLDDFHKQDVTKIYVSRKQNGKKVIVPSPNWWDTPVQRASGFLKSTVSDMLKFTELFRMNGMIGDEQILTPESIQQMTKIHLWKDPLIGQGCGYGLYILPDYHGATLLEHSGGIKGGGAQMYMIVEKGLAGIVLTNILSTAPTAIMNGALNCMENRPPEASHMFFETGSSATLSEYVGSYRSESMNLSLSIESKGNQLQAVVLDSPMTLKPLANDTFLLNGTLDRIQFNRDMQDQITEIDYKGLKLQKEKGRV